METPTALDVALAADTLLREALAAPRREQRATRKVSPKVAREALFVLLGDNDNWAVRPDGHDLDVWNSFLRARGDETLSAELAVLFPEHAEVMKHHMKVWALDWLRECATAGS